MPRSSEREAVTALTRLFRDQVKPLIEPLRQEIADLRAEIVKLRTEKKDLGGYVSINQICSQFGMSRSTFYRLLADPECGLEEKKVVKKVPPHFVQKIDDHSSASVSVAVIGGLLTQSTVGMACPGTFAGLSYGVSPRPSHL